MTTITRVLKTREKKAFLEDSMVQPFDSSRKVELEVRSTVRSSIGSIFALIGTIFESANFQSSLYCEPLTNRPVAQC